MNWRSLFVEKSRERRRSKLGRSWIADVLWYSGVRDYRFIRLLYNFPIGLFLGYAVYYLAWGRLNFADFNPIYSAIFMWFLIIGFACSFAISPIFRCASICVFIGGLGKSGQGVLSLYIMEQLSDGPMANILHNVELTSNIIICHLELESELINQRVALATGPLEHLFEKEFGSSTAFGKKTIKMLKSLVDPFRDELQFSNSEDEALSAEIDAAEAVAERESLVVGSNAEKSETTPQPIRPAWTKLKTELGRNVARRAQQRCEETLALAIKRCHETFAETQAKCYDNLPIIGYFVCGQFNALEICQPQKIKEFAEQKCKFGKEMEDSNVISPDLDDQIEKMENISKELNDQLKMNLHFVAVEQPNDERMRILSEIKSEITSDVKFFQLVGNTIKELLSALLIILIYFTFRDSVSMIRNYLNDIDFQNHFSTSYFWFIDEKRRLAGKTHLGSLNRAEKKQYGLKSPFSLPSILEIKQAWMPLVRFIITIFIVLTVVLLDHYFYRVLYNVVTFGKVEVKQQGVHTIDVHVEGHGTVAEMIRKITDFSYKNDMTREVSNRVCIIEPTQPDWSSITTHIFLPLLAMLFLQVMFSYVIRRIVLFYVVGLIFRKRSKARIIQLYNRVLLARENDLRLNRMKLMLIEAKK